MQKDVVLPSVSNMAQWFDLYGKPKQRPPPRVLSNTFASTRIIGGERSQGVTMIPGKMMGDKIIMAGADWCGFTKKAKKEIEDNNLQDKFTVLDCDGDDKDNKYCKGVTGFPMFKTEDNELCYSGYGPLDKVMTKCKVGEAEQEQTSVPPPVTMTMSQVVDTLGTITDRLGELEAQLKEFDV